MKMFNEILSSYSAHTCQIYSQLFSVDGLLEANAHVYNQVHVIMPLLISADSSIREYLD